ncbi:CTD kinase subunit gamma [Lachnellula willkommii]|uniref:CTD kinase subunit gamma n=1 Tax=Lachnellula willkommii TaxID=215461 RepID=A0A559LYS8_9HELO|nr:CTD kinase subunit gamma [Lachnellula willkommii]
MSFSANFDFDFDFTSPPHTNRASSKPNDPFESSYHHDPVVNSSSVPIPDRGHGTTAQKRMDPFEVRIRFTQHLQHLNASVTSANKAAQYALKYRDMDEDLHSCILEQLERVRHSILLTYKTTTWRKAKANSETQNTMNNRANIMYFIEHLCDASARESHTAYIRMMERDILRVVDAVAPEDGSGAANVKVVRKVLQALQQKSFLLPQTILEIEECLKERDTLPSSSPADVEMTPASRNGNVAYVKLDKKQVEQRIEEDRERHKRLRENIWAVPRNEDLEVEFGKLWDETSDLGEDDFILYEEEAAERREAARDWAEEYSIKVKVSANE